MLVPMVMVYGVVFCLGATVAVSSRQFIRSSDAGLHGELSDVLEKGKWKRLQVSQWNIMFDRIIASSQAQSKCSQCKVLIL